MRAIANSPTVKEPNETPELLLLSQIDSAIETIIHYFSASNWDETYSIVHNKLQATTHTVVHDNTDSDIVPGIELFGILYLDAHRAEIVLNDFYNCAPKMKLPLHRLMIEHFLQHSLVYWILSHPIEYSSIHQYPSLIKVISNLFDYVYGCADDDKRRHSSWRFLSTLISLLPSAFDDFELKYSFSSSSDASSITSSKSSRGISAFTALKSKPSSTSSKLRSLYPNSANNNSSPNLNSSNSSDSFTNASSFSKTVSTSGSKNNININNNNTTNISSSLNSGSLAKRDKASQRRIAFLHTLTKLSNISSKSSIYFALLISATEIAKAASIHYIHAPSSPIVVYAKSLYSILLTHLFPSASIFAHNNKNNSSTLPYLYEYQCAFVTSYSVLCSDNVTIDIYPLLQSNEDLLINYIPSILQGNIDLRLLVCLLLFYIYHFTF